MFWPYNKNLRPEFFPIRLCYISVKIYGFWKWLFAGNFLRYTAVNPGFPLWWLYPSSKWDILKQLPEKWVPKTIVINQDDFSTTKILEKISESDITFPLIFKPDNGLRWLGIEIFHTQEELNTWLQSYVDSEGVWGIRLIQEFIDEPEEFGVFYVRMPDEPTWAITGIVEKEFLELVGDGKSTFKQLVHWHPRARYHVELLEKEFESRRTEVIPDRERIDIVEIWTHSRGSTFLDASSHITLEMKNVIDTVAQHIHWFYYWRFDVRAKNIHSLQLGDFKVIEVNPTYGEPTWMYDPSYSFFQQQKILLKHWKIAYQIARKNHRLGTPYASFSAWKKASSAYGKLLD